MNVNVTTRDTQLTVSALAAEYGAFWLSAIADSNPSVPVPVNGNNIYVTNMSTLYTS